MSAAPVAASQNEIKAATAPVPPVRPPNRCDVRRMARCSEPIVDGGANGATPNRRFSPPLVAGDQQNEAVAARHSAVELAIDGPPGAVERQAMEIHRPVGLHVPAPQPLVPATIETGPDRALLRRCVCRLRSQAHRLCCRRSIRRRCRHVRLILVAGKWPDRRGDSRPQGRFLRGERAHAPPRPSAAGHKRRRCRTCRRRSAWLPRHCPRRCRSDWHP